VPDEVTERYFANKYPGNLIVAGRYV